METTFWMVHVYTVIRENFVVKNFRTHQRVRKLNTKYFQRTYYAIELRHSGGTSSHSVNVEKLKCIICEISFWLWKFFTGEKRLWGEISQVFPPLYEPQSTFTPESADSFLGASYGVILKRYTSKQEYDVRSPVAPALLLNTPPPTTRCLRLSKQLSTLRRTIFVFECTLTFL